MSERPLDVEVAVIGLGIMGACSLWRVATRGVSAAGFDRHHPPHAFGSSHGHSRMLRKVQFEGDAYVPLVKLAYRLWSELERDAGETVFNRTGLLILGPPDSQLIRGAVESSLATGVDHELLETASIRARYPQHVVAAGDRAVFDPVAGYVSPERAITAALASAEALGAEVRRGCEVRSLSVGDGAVVLETTTGPIRARTAVVAAGAWLGTLVPELAPAIKLERHFFCWVPVRDRSAYAPLAFPMFIRENDARSGTAIEESHAHRDRIASYGFPLDGAEDRIKVGFPVTGVPADSPAVDRRPRTEELAAVRRLTETLVGVGAEPYGFTPCVYDNSPDGDFLIGGVRSRPGVTVLGGFSGAGFKHATAVGEIAAALANGEPSPVDIARWSPERFLRRE